MSRSELCLLLSFSNSGACANDVPAIVMWMCMEVRSKLCLFKSLRFEFCLFCYLVQVDQYTQSLPPLILFIHSCQGNLKSQARLFPNEKPSVVQHYPEIENSNVWLSRNCELCPQCPLPALSLHICSGLVWRLTVTLRWSCLDLGCYLSMECLCPDHIMLKSSHFKAQIQMVRLSWPLQVDRHSRSPGIP